MLCLCISSPFMYHDEGNLAGSCPARACCQPMQTSGLEVDYLWQLLELSKLVQTTHPLPWFHVTSVPPVQPLLVSSLPKPCQRSCRRCPHAKNRSLLCRKCRKVQTQWLRLDLKLCCKFERTAKRKEDKQQDRKTKKHL